MKVNYSQQEMRRLTVWQSYLAMYTYRDEFADLITSDEFKNILRHMKIGMDGVPVNAVMRDKWREVVQQVVRVDASTDNCRLTSTEAYLVMFRFCDYIYFKTKSDEVGSTLGSMQIFEDEKPADAAIWGEWMAVVGRVLKKEK